MKAKDVPPLRKYWKPAHGSGKASAGGNDAKSGGGGGGVSEFAIDKAFFAEGMRFGGTIWE